MSVHPAIRDRAIAKLDGPNEPDALSYLRDILDELHARSGLGGMSVAPLTYEAILAWEVKSGRAPLTWLETRALMYLDSLLIAAPPERKSPPKDVKHAPTAARQRTR